MILFTEKQLQELLDIIDKHHTMFITTNIGTPYLSTSDRQVLKKAGIDISSWSKKKGKVDEAFVFGILSSSISDDRVKGMDYKQFKRFISSKNYIPLNSKEKSAIKHLKFQTLTDIKSLSSKVKSDLTNSVVSIDEKLQSNFNEILREEAIKNIELRKGVRDLISELGHKTGQWEANLGRIAEYTLHNAYEEGRAAQLERQYGGDVYVYKDVYPGACKHCIKHYLTAGIGSQPIIFKLSDLRSNGTNISKRVNDWRATLGPLHPHCRCTLNELPEGYVWDDDSKSFIKGSPKITNKKILNRKKVKIKIGQVEYLV